MNLWAITGNIGGDVKVNKVGDSSVANFSVAVTAGYGDKKQTIWVACALWGKQAESKLVDYLVKGQQVALTGEMSTRDHDGKTYVQLRVGSIDLVGGKRDESVPQQSRPSQQPAANNQNQDEDFSDDIPF